MGREREVGTGVLSTGDERVDHGAGRIRSVAAVMMPSVPSEPMDNWVRSSPATFLMVRHPGAGSAVGEDDLEPSTLLRVTPYLTQRMPPALVARLPPMVEISKLPGSGG